MYDCEKNQLSLVSVERFAQKTRYAFGANVFLSKGEVLEIKPAQSGIEIKSLVVNNQVALIRGFVTMLDMSKESKKCIP